MAALTAEKAREKTGEGVLVRLPVAASTTIYRGAIVCVNTSGFAIPAADTANLRCVGIATETVANTGSAGDKGITVEHGHLEKIATAVIVQADVFLDAVVADDQTVTDAAAGTNDVRVGRVEQFETGFAWVRVARHGLAAA